MQPTVRHAISVPYSSAPQIQHSSAPDPTKLDQFKEAGRNYDPKSPDKFVSLCREISHYLVEIRQKYSDNGAYVSAPVFDAIEELIKEQNYTPAWIFLRLIKTKLNIHYEQRMDQLQKSVQVKSRIIDRSNCFSTDDTESMNQIKNFFLPENQITYPSAEHTEKMIPIEKLLAQLEKFFLVNDQIENQPTCLFNVADYSENPSPLNTHFFGAQTLSNKEMSTFTNTPPLLPRKINFSLESVADENFKYRSSFSQGAHPPTVRNLLSQFNAVLSDKNQDSSLTLSQKNSALPPPSLPIATGGRADFHEARGLLRNSSDITKMTLLTAITCLENAIQLRHELAKKALNELLKKAMNLRAEGRLTQITREEWVEICSVMVKKTDDVETIRQLGIALLNGNERLGIDKDLNQGLNYLEGLASLVPKGDLQSQLIVAEHYLMLAENPSNTPFQPTNVLTEHSTDSPASKARWFFMLAVNQHDSLDAKLRLKR